MEKFFDKYSFKARVQPAFFIVFPAVITIFVLVESSRDLAGIVISFLISFGVISFLANQMSTRGNILQDKLFRKWGGAPTTIILRHSDDHLDKYTKERYMKRLETLIENFVPVTPEQEKSDPNDADEMYRSGVNYLRGMTRDAKKYPLVFKENMLYGFSRNIMAFKWIGIIVSSLSLVASLLLIYNENIKGKDQKIYDILQSTPPLEIGLFTTLLVILFMWTFMVSEKWVKIRGFAYAKALLASCEVEVPVNSLMK